MNIETSKPNIVPVAPLHPEVKGTLRLVCVECGTWHPIGEMWADTNGKPFRAFYCNPCADIKKGEG